MSVTVTQELTQQTVTVTGNPVENNVTVTVSNARGPAGPNSVTSATTSDGTANLSLATATVSGTLTAPTAATTTSTTQVATTAFVQQELASGVAVAKNLEFLAHNGSGATIAKGSIVYINGAVSGVPRITKSQANNDTNSARTIGFVKADITNGSNGFVIIDRLAGRLGQRGEFVLRWHGRRRAGLEQLTVACSAPSTEEYVTALPDGGEGWHSTHYGSKEASWCRRITATGADVTFVTALGCSLRFEAKSFFADGEEYPLE